MSSIEEIIGNKKYVGSNTTNLNTRILLEQPNKIIYENDLFDNVSQVTQFNTEKTSCNQFRFYGKLNPIMSLDTHKKSTSGDVKINLDLSIFEVNQNNWSIVLLKSKYLPAFKPTANGGESTQISMKGVKFIERKDATGAVTFSLDLRKGLPAKTYYDRTNAVNACLYFPLGHNFFVDDKIYITSKNSYNVPTGFYKVVSVDIDKIYINVKPRSFYAQLFTRDVSFSAMATAAVATPLAAFNTGTITSANNNRLVSSMNVRNLMFKTSDIQIFSTPRAKIFPYVMSEYSVAKVIEKEQLEYYIKTLEVIDIIDELDDCGFSNNNFNMVIKNFFLNHDVDISKMTDNLKEPISDLYIGVIKNGSMAAGTFGNVESHFARFIDFVGEGDGLEQVTDNAKQLGRKVKRGDVFYYGLCEYSTEQLIESDISLMSHKFIHKDVLFNYKPFYKKQLKLKSTYIENGDNVYNIAAHAVFSRLGQHYIWRDLLDIGVADENGNVIDFPFMNGAFYAYTDINFFVKSEKSSTRKYVLNTNDITSINGSVYGNYVADILNDINIDSADATDSGSNNNTTGGGVKPYYQYTDVRC